VINRTGAGHWELATIRAAFVLLAFAALAALDARPAAAEIYRPWCIQGFVTCTFTSFEQCMMTVPLCGAGSGFSNSPSQQLHRVLYYGLF
jgi:hypothetical protein